MTREISEFCQKRRSVQRHEIATLAMDHVEDGEVDSLSLKGQGTERHPEHLRPMVFILSDAEYASSIC